MTATSRPMTNSYASPGQLNRPYPNPTNVGRRFSQQPQDSHPKPMSGISTIRGHLNTHLEDPNASYEAPFQEEYQGYRYELPTEQDWVGDAEYYENTERYDEGYDHDQDFSANPTIYTEELNNIANAAQLPFITLHGLKFLIDNGACHSIMNPNIANTVFHDYLFEEPFSIQSVHAQTIGKDNVQFPIFCEHQIETPVKFRVMQWHKYFDGLIGTADFVNLHAKIDYNKQILTLRDKDIRFHFHSPHKIETS